MTLIDANVLLDLATDDPNWSRWSVARLEEASLRGPLLINDVIYAELSVRYDTIESLEDFLSEARIEMVPIPREALFLAAKAFARYRRLGGTKSGVLPDFFYRRASSGGTSAAADAGRGPLSNLFPHHRADFTWSDLIGQKFNPAGRAREGPPSASPHP